MDFRSANVGLVLLLCSLIVLALRCEASICSPTCNKAWCKEPVDCKYEIVDDVCLCCKTCAPGPGEPCGGLRFPPCAKGWVCDDSSEADEEPGKCVEAR